MAVFFGGKRNALTMVGTGEALLSTTDFDPLIPQNLIIKSISCTFSERWLCSVWRFRKLEKAVAVRNSLLERFSGKFRRCWEIILRNAMPAKIWALSSKENGCCKIGSACGNAARFSPPRPETATAFLSSSGRCLGPSCYGAPKNPESQKYENTQNLPLWVGPHIPTEKLHRRSFRGHFRIFRCFFVFSGPNRGWRGFFPVFPFLAF